MAEYLPAPEQDVAVTARVRLARNFEDLPFSHRQNEMQGEECVRRVCSAVLSGEEGKAYTLYRMGDMDETIRQELGEHRLITGEMVSARHGAALQISLLHQTVHVYRHEICLDLADLHDIPGSGAVRVVG